MRTTEEITALYERHADTVWRVCYSFMRNEHDAQDMMQDTFMKLMNSSMVFKDQDHEKAWLIVTAANLCKDALKSRARLTEDIEAHEELTAPEPENLGLKEAILSLPEEEKEIIYMYYYEGYRTAEIAEMLNKPSSTIRSKLARAREKLKKKLEE